MSNCGNCLNFVQYQQLLFNAELGEPVNDFEQLTREQLLKIYDTFHYLIMLKANNYANAEDDERYKLEDEKGLKHVIGFIDGLDYVSMSMGVNSEVSRNIRDEYYAIFGLFNYIG